MSQRSRTGGGVGTNQYQVRGHSRFEYPEAPSGGIGPDEQMFIGASLSEPSSRLSMAVSRADTPPALLRRVIHSNVSYETLLAVARHPQADASILAELYERSEPSVRCAVLEHPHCPMRMLKHAAHHRNASGWVARCRVQQRRHPETWPRFMANQRPDQFVAFWTWEARTTPATYLAYMAAAGGSFGSFRARQHMTDIVRCFVWYEMNREADSYDRSQNIGRMWSQLRGLDPGELEQLVDAATDSTGHIAGAIPLMWRSDCTPDIYNRLIEQDDPQIRLQLAQVGGCPSELIQRLMRDPDSRVREAAQIHPNLPVYLRQLGQVGR